MCNTNAVSVYVAVDVYLFIVSMYVCVYTYARVMSMHVCVRVCCVCVCA